MELWISSPKEVSLKLNNTNASKLVKEIKANKQASKESKHMAEALERLLNDYLS